MLTILRDKIRETVDSLCHEPHFREAAVRALSRPGFSLHLESKCRAGVLTLEVCRSIKGRPDKSAFLAASAVELQMDAAFMFDHVADLELEPNEEFSAAEELALAIALLNCGASVAFEAAYSEGRKEIAHAALRDFHRDYIQACGGQYLDANFGLASTASVEQALDMTSNKSGSLGRFAAGFGAGIATDDHKASRLFGDFGYNIFTFLQIVDDLRDACPKEESWVDLTQHKKTVPLVYFYNFLSEERDIDPDDIILHINSMRAPEVIHNFEESGATLFGGIVAEVFFNRAKNNLTTLKEQLYQVENLERFVDSIETSSKGVLVASR